MDTLSFGRPPLYVPLRRGASYSCDQIRKRPNSVCVSPDVYNSSNELTSTPLAGFSYDENGNTTSKTDGSGTTNYTWDYENRLTSVSLPSTGTVNFIYDPFGRRILKSSANGTAIYAYDGDNIVEGLDAGGGVSARYSQGAGIDEPLAMYRGTTTSYYHADGRGSVTSLTDGSGTVAASYVYDSFGNLSSSTGSLTNSFRYTAREFDSETGLYYYRARYYDPAVGRFLSEDPIRFQGGINFFGYVGNDPTNFIDPTGYAVDSPCLNIDNFTQWLDDHAHKTSQRHCAGAVRRGLEAGGLDTTGRPDLAKNYGPFLEGNGFSQVPTGNYSLQKGDIVVIQPGPSPAGHIQAWDGSTWVSDFTQSPNKISPYSGSAPSYTIYRPSNPCPTSTGTGSWQNSTGTGSWQNSIGPSFWQNWIHKLVINMTWGI